MKKENVFWGILFILGAILTIVSNLGYLPNVSFIKILFSLFMIKIIISSAFKLNFYGILFPIAIILLLFDKELNITKITPGPVLIAALLGSIGLSLLFKKNQVFVKKNKDRFSSSVTFDDDNSTVIENRFGSKIKYINSNNFENADIICNFGSVEVFFDQAKMLSDTANINIDCSFGAVELYLPENWQVIDRTTISFGALEIQENEKIKDKKVIISGTISFAGIEIKYI